MAATKGAALVVTNAAVLSAAQLSEAESLLKDSGASHPDVASRCTAESLKDLPQSSYSVVVSLAHTPGQHTQQVLTQLARVILPGGALFLQEPVAVRTPHAAEEQAVGKSKVAGISSKAVLERSLLLGGFSTWTPSNPLPSVGLHQDWAGLTPASVGSLQGPLLQPMLLKAVKPQWTSGASFSLKRKTAASTPSSTVTPTSSTPTSTPARASWKLSGTEDDGEELIDEDTLLTEEDLVVPTNPVAASGCDSSKPMRKACKNCNCGRAEMEESAANGDSAAVAKLSLDQIENPQSACGSCGLGDAFRCAGCPYRGLPPFKLGEKVTLGSAALSADA